MQSCFQCYFTTQSAERIEALSEEDGVLYEGAFSLRRSINSQKQGTRRVASTIRSQQQHYPPA